MSGRAAKYIVVIGDGMADFALEELGGRTPLHGGEEAEHGQRAQPRASADR